MSHHRNQKIFPPNFKETPARREPASLAINLPTGRARKTDNFTRSSLTNKGPALGPAKHSKRHQATSLSSNLCKPKS